MAQVRGLGPRVGGRLALFCIHRLKPGVYNVTYSGSNFMDMLWHLINCRIIIIITPAAFYAWHHLNQFIFFHITFTSDCNNRRKLLHRDNARFLKTKLPFLAIKNNNIHAV